VTAPTRRAPSTLPEPPSPVPPTGRGLGPHLRGVLPVLLAALLVGGFFLGLYLVKGYRTPIGWDTARYVSEANLAADLGLSGVERLAPPPQVVQTSRVGYSVLDLTLSSLFALSRFKVAASLPPATAVALALAGGALASAALRRGPWEAGAVALAVGISPTLIRLMAPETYAENLLALAPLTAALVVVVAARPPDGVALGASILLVVGGALSHGPSAAIVAGALGLAALFYLPASWRAWRGRTAGLLATPAGFLGATAAGAGIVTGGAVFGLLGAVPERFHIGRTVLAQKLTADLPLYRLGLSVPIAAVGLADLIDGRVREPARESNAATPRWSRAGLTLLLLGGWTLLTVAGIGLFAVGRAAPAHRFLALLVPLPLLMGLGLVALGRLVGTRSRAPIGVAVVLVGLLALLVAGHRTYYRDLPRERGVLWMDPQKMQDAATAADYLDRVGVPPDAPVVFIVEDIGPQPVAYVPLMAYMIRSVLPAERIEDAYMYVGNPERYLDSLPTLRDQPGSYNGNSLRFWAALRPILPGKPVTLLLSSFNPAYGAFAAEHPERIVGPNLAVVQGPIPEQPLGAAVPPSGPQGLLQLVLIGGATLGALALAGLGWALAMFPRGLRSFEALALAPATGIAVVVIAGLIVDGLGIRLTGIGGALVPVIAAAGGFAAAVSRLRRYGRGLFPPA
jgi:hypothetical protein